MAPGLFLLVLTCLVVVHGEPKCTGSPKMLNGLYCASTNRFFDYHQGACGCGEQGTDDQFEWAHRGYTAAVNQHFWDKDDAMKSWCGARCGKCVELTPTGGFIEERGEAVNSNKSVVFMITNFCPNEWPNVEWCSQTTNNNENAFGYKVHFNLEDGAGQLTKLGWGDKNPEVTYQLIDCDEAYKLNKTTLRNAMYHQCQCYYQGKK